MTDFQIVETPEIREWIQTVREIDPATHPVDDLITLIENAPPEAPAKDFLFGAALARKSDPAELQNWLLILTE